MGYPTVGIDPNELGTVRRMVAIAKTATTSDFVENTSIHYAKQRGGGPIGLIADLNFSTLGFGDKLFIVAHGKPGSSGDYEGKAIAALLTDEKKGIKQSGVNIIFTSCNAGTEENVGFDDSVVATVSKSLDAQGLANFVAGATGNSLKHDEVQGGAFTAIKQAVVGKALGWQNFYKNIHEPQKKFDEWVQSNAEATPEEKAAAASTISKSFFEAFVLKIREQRLNIEDTEAISSRAGWGN
jgi:hypothetical protein